MNDDLDEEIIGSDDGGFDEFVQKNTLGDLWRNNPLVKAGIIIFAVAVIIGAIIIFGAEKEKPNVSMLPPGSEVSAPPGTDAASPAYIAAVEAQNEAELERALRTGDSTLPVPVETPSERLQLPQDEEEVEDPLHRWRRLQEERVIRETRDQEEVEPVTVLNSDQQNEAMKRLVEAMAKQMEAILGRRTEKKEIHYTAAVDKDAFSNDGAYGSSGSGQNGSGNGSDDLGEEIDEVSLEDVIIPAGEVEYAQLLIEANSDVQGPVLAVLLSGPLRGNRMLGTFQVQDEYLTLSFSTVIVNGQSIDISAMALDPDTTLPGMATDVDHRYFQRVLLPAAAAFIEGFADAIAESGTTNITIDNGGSTTSTTENDKSDKQEVATGVAEAGQEIRDIVDDMADSIDVLVKIKAGTPMGVLFLDPIVASDKLPIDNKM